MDTCFYIWKAWLLPPAEGIAEICNAYNVHRVAIKFLDGVFRYNSTNWAGDANLKLFVNILRANGIGVDGWGYHYPYSPGPQGDAIEERREKFQLETYLLDIEKEWKTDPNPAPEMRTLLDKVKVGGFTCLANSYKFPTYHSGIPWAAMMEHAAIDGAAPQVYWEQAHNPAAQLERSYSEYARYNKPFIPCGSAYGRGDWLPTLADFIEFRNWCHAKKIPRIYWWSLDWVILKNKVQEWMPALCGMDDNPQSPGDEDMRYKVIKRVTKRKDHNVNSMDYGMREVGEIVIPQATWGDVNYPGAYWVLGQDGYWSAVQYYKPTVVFMESFV